MTTLCVGDSHVRRLERSIDARQPSSVTYGIANLEQVDYYGISGGLVSNNRHLCILTDAMRRYRPRHIIVFIGGNDLDSRDANFDVECVVTRLVAFLTQLERRFHLQSVSVLSLCLGGFAEIFRQTFITREFARQIIFCDKIVYTSRLLIGITWLHN